MIERKFVKENLKEFQIQEFINSQLFGVGHSKTKLVKTPLGDKVIIYSSRPGLVVGKGGSSIIKLTKQLQSKFRLENPQLEISEVSNPDIDPNIIAEKIVVAMERFGSARFKGLGHKSMSDIMQAGAKGVEILISGKVPSMRAKTWRFYMGYLKKCGDISDSQLLVSQKVAKLKSGVVGVKVTIMPSDIRLPDDVVFINKIVEEVEDITEKEEAKEIEEEVKNKEKNIEKKQETTKEKVYEKEKIELTKKAKAKQTEKETEKETENKKESKSTPKKTSNKDNSKTSKLTKKSKAKEKPKSKGDKK